eukprot:gene6871-biopygen11956
MCLCRLATGAPSTTPCANPCTVSVYATWAPGYGNTGAAETVTGTGVHPLPVVGILGVSSAVITGGGCAAEGFTTADCSGAAGGTIDAATQVSGYPAGVFTPASVIRTYWGCNDCVQCVRITCGPSSSPAKRGWSPYFASIGEVCNQKTVASSPSRYPFAK